MFNKIIGLAVVLLLIVIGVVVVTSRKPASLEPSVTTPVVDTEMPVPSDEATKTPELEVVTEPVETRATNAISIEDQPVAGSVKVASVSFATSGFIVIHEDKDSKPGAIIATSSVYAAGSFRDVSLSVTKKLNQGISLYAMLHKDDGDGAFEFPGPDEPLKDNAGTVVMMKFKVLAPVKTEGKVIEMISKNFSFEPNKLTLKKGEPVTIKIKNSGVHTFTIDELGINKFLSGETAEVTFTPQKAGTFEFYCAVGQHRAQGMFGTLTVTE